MPSSAMRLCAESGHPISIVDITTVTDWHLTSGCGLKISSTGRAVGNAACWSREPASAAFFCLLYFGRSKKSESPRGETGIIRQR
jgi:hypothetical protein